MNPQALTLSLPDEDATTALAERLAPLLGGQVSGVPAGGRIHLHGDLGAGKTHFVRALLRACGVTGRIKSPSYALLESYKVSSLYFYHLDFYRFSDPREWVDAGFRDILQDNAVVLIEWPEKAGDLLPEPDLDLDLDYCGDGRLATLDARSAKGTLWITTLAPSQQK
ncbi:tRNA (adenosine(37)-N6)-threonylcarbamoyltransferase complex ATPase subunit type 1 TsaE [Alcaligenes faecalis]|uniref:tRNA (adenosine(37)-N6)-threonylcarbamoyltransferase complex ATPase subunit type 1 TsaE n=1 Tax=Alcaligenes faecalis TaxID=511 RepID=UPI001C83295C|nr:tRNA (adenosine(37)-N6)-threonylcarbamoyltransferase complex ATPase subunit type 1 TsaE [Alcaligenes faecalis]MBX6965545.1 tRNA (adenosine(37)-N6)-threonylcarbamoyltransferase complex ATPase subunit type 1 TsaE [Providencia rettgeri]MBX7030752.1 tRNA (adenosine(37)-N6)-threonylcarbamoyltransferase complex ATPase subunit type 1 TsaE [Alcaligenes faecalis]